jgi:hypothetical protein
MYEAGSHYTKWNKPGTEKTNTISSHLHVEPETTELISKVEITVFKAYHILCLPERRLGEQEDICQRVQNFT